VEMQIIRAADIKTEPFVSPPEGRLDLVDLFAQPQGAPFAAGVCEIWAGGPVAFDYDNDAAVCFMVEGTITLTEDGHSHVLEVGDVVYLPQREGLVVDFASESHGRFFYVTYPHWR
jgi:ethanolamine utilization protein EutQ (cupin superfamily)